VVSGGFIDIGCKKGSASPLNIGYYHILPIVDITKSDD
jgi:hypothetical protein